MGRTQRGLSPSIQSLWPHHVRMAQLVAAGYRPSQVAEITGYSAGQISRIIQSPLFVAEVNRLQAGAEAGAVDIHAGLRQMAERALVVMSENLDPEVPDVPRELKTKTAMDVLDRTGFGKKDKPSLNLHMHAHAVKKVSEMSQEELYATIVDGIEAEDE